jgi:hypothetical protein
MTADREVSPPPPLTDYIMQFSATYVLCILVVVLVAYVLEFDAPSAMGIIVLIAAMSPPIRSFVSDNRRVFDPRERARFATGVAFASLALNVAFAGAFSYVATVVLHQRSPLIDAIEEATQQGISVNEVLGLTALIWLSVAWVIAYLFALFSARSWHRNLSSA